MMELNQITQIAHQVGVSPEVILMESWQLLVLEELSQRPLSKQLVFKGGTCLRLAYGSFRFSEDLDFSMLTPVEFVSFKRWIKQLAKRYPNLLLDEIFDMKQTLFARLVINQGKYRVGLKIEISKRIENWQRQKDFQFKLLFSPASMAQPYFQVATLERIYRDKIRAVHSRKKPRDWFDLWYLSQKLDKPFNQKVNLPKKLMLDRVRFLLPCSKRLILEEFEYES